MMDENHTCRRTMVDDSKMREQLAKLIGLDAVPEIDPNAIEKLDGLFDDLVDGPVDCVQLLKEVRIRDFCKNFEDTINCPYKQLVDDYLELNGGIDFGRIMSFIWKKLPNKELYLVIRRKVTLKRLCEMMDGDWCENALRSESGSRNKKLDPKTSRIFNTKIPNIGRCDLLIKLASGWK